MSRTELIADIGGALCCSGCLDVLFIELDRSRPLIGIRGIAACRNSRCALNGVRLRFRLRTIEADVIPQEENPHADRSNDTPAPGAGAAGGAAA